MMKELKNEQQVLLGRFVLLFSLDFCSDISPVFFRGNAHKAGGAILVGFFVPRNTWDACLLQAMQRRSLAWIHKKFQGFRVSNSLKFLTQNKKSLLIAVFFYLFEFKT